MAEEEFDRRSMVLLSILVPLAFVALVSTLIFEVVCYFRTNLIDEICKNNGMVASMSKVPVEDDRYFYSFCKTSLKAAPGIDRAAYLPEFGLIAIGLLRDNATETLFYIRRLLLGKKKKKGMDLEPSMKRLLENCLVLYSAGIGKLTNEVMEEYTAEKFFNDFMHVSTFLTSSTACEDSFREVGLVSPLTKQNNDAKWLTLMSLRILDALRPKW